MRLDIQQVISQPPKSRWACPNCKCLTVHVKTINGFVCVECGSPLALTESEKRPYVKEKQRAYRQRPDVKEKQRAYYQRPDVKEKQRAYRQRWRERQREKLRKIREGLTMEVLL